jgi:TLD
MQTLLQSNSNCPATPPVINKLNLIESSPIFAGSQPNPMSFLSSRLSQFTKATRIFSTRDYPGVSNVAKQFHEKCDGQTNTLVIIKSGQYIAGGFTEVAWKSPAYIYEYVPVTSSTQAFLYSVNRQLIFYNKDPKKAIFCDKSWGPVFGFSDLSVKGNYKLRNEGCVKNQSYSYVDEEEPYSELFGERVFTIDEYEVYKLE